MQKVFLVHKLCSFVSTGGASGLLCGDHWGQCVLDVIQQHAGVLYGCADSHSSAEIFCYTGKRSKSSHLRGNPDSKKVITFRFQSSAKFRLLLLKSISFNTFLFKRSVISPL